LTIAKQFVEMHGGRIAAATRDGGGTRITLSLPRRARSAGDQTTAVRPIDARPPIDSEGRRSAPL
jgi:hypothetical protein